MERRTERTANNAGTWPSDVGGSADETSTSSGMSDAAGQAKEALVGTAQETVETAKSAGKEIADTAQQQIAETVDQAVSQTADTISQVKEQAGSVFMDQRDRAVSSLSGLADAMRETGKTLANQIDEGSDSAGGSAAAIGPFIDDIADRLTHSADYLKDIEVGQLISDAEDLARRQPLLFVGALFGVGVVGARLLKGSLGDPDGGSSTASSGQRGQTQHDWSTGAGGNESGTLDTQFGSIQTEPVADPNQSAWNAERTPVYGAGSSTSPIGESS